MDINVSQTKTSFTSRNKEIRDVDKIMRKLKNEYPACSTSRALYMGVVKKKPYLARKAFHLHDKLFGIRIELSKYHGIECCQKTFDEVKIDKVANCMELVRMSFIALIANGYKDVRIGSLKLSPNPRSITSNPILDSQKKADHCAVILNAGKDAILENPTTYSKHAIIVDPWAGITDYVSNVFNRYKIMFNKLTDGDIRYKNGHFLFEEWEKINIDDNLTKTLAKSKPELIVKKS